LITITALTAHTPLKAVSFQDRQNAVTALSLRQTQCPRRTDPTETKYISVFWTSDF